MVSRITDGIIAPLPKWKEKIIDRIVYNIILYALVSERYAKSESVSMEWESESETVEDYAE
jgi:hypothetical protein